MNIKPYFSLDIETTGLSILQAQVLEVALVYDDGKTEINDLPNCRVLFRPQRNYYELYAMGMHSQLLQEISKTSDNVNRNSMSTLSEFIYQHHKSHGLPTVAGKNVAGFDLPILKNNNINLEFHHRVIDVGSIYFKTFGYVPSLNEINKLLGLKHVAHTALADAFNIVLAIRRLNEV